MTRCTEHAYACHYVIQIYLFIGSYWVIFVCVLHYTCYETFTNIMLLCATRVVCTYCYAGTHVSGYRYSLVLRLNGNRVPLSLVPNTNCLFQCYRLVHCSPVVSPSIHSSIHSSKQPTEAKLNKNAANSCRIEDSRSETNLLFRIFSFSFHSIVWQSKSSI